MNIRNFRWVICLIFILSFSGVVACSPRVQQIRDADATQPPSVPKLTRIDVADLSASTQIRLEAEDMLTYTSFNIHNPPRLVIDLAGISLGKFKEPIVVNKGSVIEIYPIEADLPGRIARLNIKLTSESITSQIFRKEGVLVIDIPKVEGIDVAEKAEPEVVEAGAEVATVSEDAEPTVAEAELEVATVPAETEPEAVEAIVEEVSVATEDAEPEVEEGGAEDAMVPAETESEVVEAVVVEEVSVATEDAEPEVAEAGVEVAAESGVEKEAEIETIVEIADISPKEVKPSAIQRDVTMIKGIKAVSDDNRTNIFIVADKDIQAETFVVEGNRVVIDVKDANYHEIMPAIPVDNNIVSNIRIGRHTVPFNKVRVVADLKKEITYNVDQQNNLITVSIVANPKKSEPLITAARIAKSTTDIPLVASAEKVEPQPSPKKSSTIPPPQVESPPAVPPKYSGKKVSLDFQDADIINVLRLLAEVSGLNVVIGDNVKGRITIKMLDVPWDQALQVVLKMKGLGQIFEDNVVRIDTLTSIAQQQEEEARAKEAMIKAEDMITRILPVNYAAANEIFESVKKNLSARGDITVDVRTNTLIIRDVEGNFKEINRLLVALDKPTPQVLIEARIVQADTNFARDLGVEWGGNYSSNPGDYNVGVIGGPTGPVGAPATGFAVNLPASGIAGQKGSIGFTLGKTVGDAFSLDLRLSAGESKGLTKVLSAPKIATLDNREAVIQQGESIPYKTVSQEGTQTEFIDATLTLKVTPKVTPDGHVAMKISISKNRQGSIVVEGTPSINKKEATTEVLVKDGETTVIGGIYEITDTDNTSGIPWVYKVPVFGWFFKNTQKSNIKSELLIFITPTILSVNS